MAGQNGGSDARRYPRSVQGHPRVEHRSPGFESAAQSDNVFRDLVPARINEQTSKIDAERVLTEVGLSPASYATV